MFELTSLRPPHPTQLPTATSGVQLSSDAGRVYHTLLPPTARGVRGEVITKATEEPPPPHSWVTVSDEKHMENEVEGPLCHTVHPPL